MIDGRTYYRSLKIHKGQEPLLSGRIKQVDDEITALHFGLVPPARGTILFSEYVKKYLDRKGRNASVYHVRRRLEIIKELWPDLPLNQYAPAHIRALEKELFARKLAPATVNRYMEHLRNLWNCAIEDREAIENPIRTYEPFAEDGARRALTDDELGRILDEARRLQGAPKNKAQAVIYDMILLSLATGMRLGSILTLRKEYIQGDVLIVPITKTKGKRRGVSKGTPAKTIALSPLAQEIIKRQGQRSKDEYVFALTWRHPNIVSRTIQLIRDETGIHDFSFHSFRHTASTFVSEHSSLAAAKSVLGHADLKTTLRYTHPGLTEQRASVAKLGAHIKRISRKVQKRKPDTDSGG